MIWEKKLGHIMGGRVKKQMADRRKRRPARGAVFSPPFRRRIHRTLRNIALCVVVAAAVFFPQVVNAQLRSGGAFLKILPGVRNQGLAGSYTGVIDEMHALYANPGATGFLREWQWGTSYTEWIADTYSLSWLYGQRVPTPWSRRSTFALGLHYQGVREFNSTGNPNIPPASANDLLATLSVGEAVSQNLSLGFNIKYFRSELDRIAAASWMADLGFLIKSDRFHFRFLNFDYAILSAGMAVSQLGQSLDFLSLNTPLPRTFRAGAALNMGSHEGFQVQLTADYQKVRDEIGRISFGAEVNWRYLLGIRGGYQINDRQFSNFSLGLSYRLSEVPPLPGRKNALRFDFAYLEGNDIFSPPLRGGLSHYPLGPERFYLADMSRSVYEVTDSIDFSWETAVDPDLYDEVQYILLLTRDDPTALESLIAKNAADPDHLLLWLRSEAAMESPVQWAEVFFEPAPGKQPGYLLPPRPVHAPGEYFWTVAAFDRDEHVRFADSIGRFRVNPPPPPPPPPPPIIAYDLQVTQTAQLKPLRPEVRFHYNKATLTEKAQRQLTILGEALKSPALKDVFIKLGGHTDQRGSDAYNRQLSVRRVNSVKNYLVDANQIEQNRVFAYGYGEKYLLDDARKYPTKAQRDSIHTLNRRVEIYLLSKANRDTTNQPIRDEEIVKAVFEGQPIQYEIAVFNNGPDTAETVIVSTKIPEHARFVAESFSANADFEPVNGEPRMLGWQFWNVPPGETLRLRYALVVDQVPTNPYPLTHVTRITAAHEVDETNNLSEDTVYIIPVPPTAE